MSTTTLLMSPITGFSIIFFSFVFLWFLGFLLYIFFPIKNKNNLTKYD